MPEDRKHSARISEDIEFGDGTIRTIKPLTIKSLRKFVKIVENLELENLGSFDDDTVDKMVEAAAIIVGQSDKKLAEDRDALEEALDMEVFQKLMTVAMGNRLSDTKNE